jgi:hypothetical protein
MPRIALHIARSVVLAGLAGGVCLLNTPSRPSLVSPAAAQDIVSIAVEFHIALEPFGTWRHHARFGEVWIPDHRPAGWRPYTVGHWVCTETYGWYWIEDSDESDWGWITYHYGRWYDDPDDGWIWIVDDVWSPAWIEWREGDDVVGWAPLPPDPVIVELDARPECWIFVRVTDFVAPRIDTVVLPVHESVVYLQRTTVVNRTVVVNDRHLAVNPGIPPTHIAAKVGRPFRAQEVRPRVLAGTVNLPGAIQVHAEDWRRQRGLALQQGRERSAAPEVQNQPGRTMLKPERSSSPPQPLARGEPGRLGPTPPQASQENWHPVAPPPHPSVASVPHRPSGTPEVAVQRPRPAPAPAPVPHVAAPSAPHVETLAPHVAATQRPHVAAPPPPHVPPAPTPNVAAPPTPHITAAPAPRPVLHVAAPPPPGLASSAARPAPVPAGVAPHGGPQRRPQ